MTPFATWMKPENVPSGRGQTQKPRAHDSSAANVRKRPVRRDRESTVAVGPQGMGGAGDGEHLLLVMGFSFLGDGNVLELGHGDVWTAQ